MNLKGKMANLAFKLGKNKPHIMLGLGIIAIGAGVVYACVQTTKLEDILDEANEREHDIKAPTVSEGGTEVELTDDMKKELVKSKLVLAGDICKLYLPPVGLLATGVALVTGGHIILEKRNAALLGAYAALEETFQRYRGKVREIFGTKAEKQLMQHADGMIDLQVDDTSQKVSVTPVVKGADEAYDGGSIYSRRFCPDTTHQATIDMSRNIFFCQEGEKYFNELCRINGHVFLNEVYDYLGFKRTTEGAIVGWLWHEDDPVEHVKFGIFSDEGNPYGLEPGSFYGEEPYALLLDFNVDGEIYDKI